MSSFLSKPDFPASPATLPEAVRGGIHAGIHGHPSSPRALVRATTPVLGWLKSRLSRALHREAPPLDLEMTDRLVRFRGMREFEFALLSRTGFPATRMRELMAHSPAELEAAAARVHDVERRFSNVLARSVNEPGLIGELFRELELKLFSQDHGWREIMEGLMRLTPAYDPYKRVALVRYMQYLRARQTIMRSAFVEKTRDDDSACLHATRAIDEGIMAAHGDTDLFNRGPEARQQPAGEPAFIALPKGESMRVDPGRARHIELMLAGNHMRLYTGRECYIVDDGNNTYPLRAGKNLVGRHRGCDVVLDPACKSISRTHLIVEPTAGGRVLLTDLSAHGTEVAAAGLEPA